MTAVYIYTCSHQNRFLDKDGEPARKVGGGLCNVTTIQSAYLCNEQMLNHFLHLMRTTHPTIKKYTQNIDLCEKITTSEQTVTTLKWEGVFFLGL